MRVAYHYLLLLLVSALNLAPVSAQTINVDAVNRYWEITNELRQDQPLTDQAWQDFLELPGNKVYVKNVFSARDLAAYRRAIEVVYMPRHDSLRQAKIRAKSWYYVLVNDYKQREQEYKAFISQVAASPAAVDLMYTNAYAYLPKRYQTRVADLKIYYVAMGNDATSQHEGIFYSLRSAVDAHAIKPGILEGHEMHHQLNQGSDLGTIAAADEGLLGILLRVQGEGIPDLIDKKWEVALPGDPQGIRAWGLDPAPTFLQRMDSVLQSQARGGAGASLKFYRQLSWGSNGHVPGFYMASVIERNGYTKQMLATIDDRFAFVQLYQKAAKKDKAKPYVFSAAAMRYLKQLARTYSHPRPAPAAEAVGAAQ
ncbi:DUF5700 domain-containing putative Zn-dependent protease [Hymenobacter cellulosivorans]|uniref:DUF2268 domain-containing protein n=1 Tax=Hymenobacter cellulosivorans TaxID=2932249 RepID=A0ABY4F584_9BACT|nr:DUF5700 domain-containing putative Zn-dependent protease [Hymenobacter cellulosivorans]UOQ51834.1 hypothetical protein MUN80_18975 [Hymenobacter cellulosivorans]